MHIELCHRLTPNVDVLNLLRGDVFTLCQLEDVLLPVNDFQCAILQGIGKMTPRRNLCKKKIIANKCTHKTLKQIQVVHAYR